MRIKKIITKAIDVDIEESDLPDLVQQDIEDESERLTNEYCKNNGLSRNAIYESVSFDVTLNIHRKV